MQGKSKKDLTSCKNSDIFSGDTPVFSGKPSGVFFRLRPPGGGPLKTRVISEKRRGFFRTDCLQPKIPSGGGAWPGLNKFYIRSRRCFPEHRHRDKLPPAHSLFIQLFFTLLLTTSCATIKKTVVNYKLKEARDKKSDQVVYSPPPPPFRQRKNEHSDAFWWNKETKNSISYFSSCPKTAALISLKEIEAGALSELANHKIIKTEQKGNTRQTQIQMTVDGKVILTDLHIIKTQRCFYILNFVSDSQESFRKDEPVFRRFISGFKGL